MACLILGDTSTSELDIYLSLNGSPIDVPSILFNIKNPIGTVVSSGNGTHLETGHYAATSGTIPSGESTGTWSVTWIYTTPGGNTLSATEEFCVSNSIEAGFAQGDVTDIITAVRIDIGDDGDNPTFTDAKLKQFISKSVIMLNGKLDTESTSGVFQFNGDIFDRDINDREKYLIILQIECLINQREFRSSSSRGVRIQDGDTQIDTIGRLGPFKDVTFGPGSACAELKEAITDYNDEVGGAGPEDFGIIWKGNSRRVEIHSHNDISQDRKFEVYLDFDDYFGGNSKSSTMSNDGGFSLL